jgi:hypothetical protein
VPENRVPRRIFGPKTKELEAEFNFIRIFITFTQQVALTMMEIKGDEMEYVACAEERKMHAQLRIREVSGSNLSPETDYPD